MLRVYSQQCAQFKEGRTWRTPQLAHPHPAQSPAHEEQLEHAQGPIVTGIWVGSLV